MSNSYSEIVMYRFRNSIQLEIVGELGSKTIYIDTEAADSLAKALTQLSDDIKTHSYGESNEDSGILIPLNKV